MISEKLSKFAQDIDLESDKNFDLRISFGVSCIVRVRGLITEPQIEAALSIGENFVNGECGIEALNEAATLAHKAAQSHAGSGNAAVSVSRGVAAALAGRALEASEYAAYASVYSYASYAVTDLSAYAPEQKWQLSRLMELADLVE